MALSNRPIVPTASNVRARNAVKIDDDAPVELLGPLGSGIMTGSGAVLNVLSPSAGESIEAIREITDGRRVSYALDTTGGPPVFSQMTKSLALRGHSALVRAAKLGTEAPFDIGALLTSGINISMVVEGDAVPREFIPKLVKTYERGMFPFEKLVKTYDFKGINQAFADSESGATIKPVVVY